MLGEAVHTVNLQGDMTTLPLAGHAPSGLGFRPDGSLLIVSTENRQVLRYDGETVTTLADLGGHSCPQSLGDMVVDDRGRAYVGSQACEGGVIVRVDPDDSVDRRRRGPRLPQRNGDHAGPHDADRRRVDRPAADGVHHRLPTGR